VSEGAVQRRLAAILAADMVGYSRLMGQDEAGTLAALKACRAELIDPKIFEHKGRVFKAIGDGVLAEFPSVVNAVACAIDIQLGMQTRNSDDPTITLRVGVNIGDADGSFASFEPRLRYVRLGGDSGSTLQIVQGLGLAGLAFHCNPVARSERRF
jgi:hypothetical protein